MALLSLSPSLQLQAQVQAHEPAKRSTLPGVKNFAELTPFLYRGAQPSQQGFQALSRMGISIVVDARLSGQNAERKAVTSLGMQYESIPWHCMFPNDKAIARFLKVLRDNPGKKVFVHCRYGDDRTGMMIAAYRMTDENWTAEDALKEMQKFGYHSTWCFPLGSYEKGFPSCLSRSGSFR